MIDEEVCASLNGQLGAEIYSAYLYVAMASYFEQKNLKGFANWMRIQIQEELAHANKFHTYIIERGGKPAFSAIEAPETEWKSPLAVFEFAFAHELVVTRAINTLMEKARAANDHATQQFLQWFVAEQVEEEANFDGVIQQLRLADNNGAALLMMDREMATRVFVPPTAGA
jgi:ferritin